MGANRLPPIASMDAIALARCALVDKGFVEGVDFSVLHRMGLLAINKAVLYPRSEKAAEAVAEALLEAYDELDGRRQSPPAKHQTVLGKMYDTYIKRFMPHRREK